SLSLELAPQVPSFPSPVSFECSALPPLSTCTFDPNQLLAGAGSGPVALAIRTTAPVLASIEPMDWRIAAFGLPFVVLVFSMGTQRRFGLLIRTLVLGTLLQTGCGGGGDRGGGGSGQPGTPAGTYRVEVTAACGSVEKSVEVVLTVR
ncbi:MAG TPA: hypothetical protein VH744_13255, partial [Terriglobales bacterium]